MKQKNVNKSWANSGGRQKESTSAVDVVVMPEANSSNEEPEAEKRKKRNKRNIGWSLVDD